MELKVKDLYEGAYLLCMGFQLKQLTIIDRHGKRKAVFLISGDGVEEKAESYRTGQATVNVAMLKFTLEKLKDAMFAKIRAQEQGASTQGKRGNNHGQNPHRENRRNKTKCSA